MQVLLSAIGNFPWSLSVLVMAITAMIIFREPIAVLISRSHELRAGRFFSLKAKPIDPKLIEDALRKAGETAAELWEQLDTRRLVIRDVQGRPRIIASTLPSEESFLALFDQAGQPRATLVASSAIEPDGIAMLLFHGQTAGEMASFIGAEHDGSGAIGVRDSSGVWKEIS